MDETPFTHAARTLDGDMPLVYTAMSKHLFYYRMEISRFVLSHQRVPLNPFMLFDYFLLDTVERDCVRKANNSLVQRADAIWVFGPVSNGVLSEILLARDTGKEVRFFGIEKPHAIVPIEAEEAQVESDMEPFKHLVCAPLTSP